MKILYPPDPGRPYYDRSPQAANMVYNATAVAPHAATQRGQNIIASDQNYFMQLAALNCMRVTVAGTSGTFRLFLVRGSLSSSEIIFSYQLVTNNVGSGIGLVIPQGLWIDQNTIITLFTEDLSVGGAIDWRISIQGLIYTR